MLTVRSQSRAQRTWHTQPGQKWYTSRTWHTQPGQKWYMTHSTRSEMVHFNVHWHTLSHFTHQPIRRLVQKNLVFQTNRWLQCKTYITVTNDCEHKKTKLNLIKLKPGLGTLYTIQPRNRSCIFHSHGTCTGQQAVGLLQRSNTYHRQRKIHCDPQTLISNDTANQTYCTVCHHNNVN